MRRLFRVLLAFVLLCAAPTGLIQAQQPAPKASEQKREATVYVTRTGKRYHRDGCRYLSHSRMPMSLSDAKKSGYTPCQVCHPPQ